MVALPISFAPKAKTLDEFARLAGVAEQQPDAMAANRNH